MLNEYCNYMSQKGASHHWNWGNIKLQYSLEVLVTTYEETATSRQQQGSSLTWLIHLLVATVQDYADFNQDH
jgi:hypothetical protein